MDERERRASCPILLPLIFAIFQLEFWLIRLKNESKFQEEERADTSPDTPSLLLPVADNESIISWANPGIILEQRNTNKCKSFATTCTCCSTGDLILRKMNWIDLRFVFIHGSFLAMSTHCLAYLSIHLVPRMHINGGVYWLGQPTWASATPSSHH